MMASCSFSSLVDDKDSCGQTAEYLSVVTCVFLSECQKVLQHLNSNKKYGDLKIPAVSPVLKRLKRQF